tara:strand:+ start:24 stop:314 length:291 start_codon:yes stop_codon:yes gene_type:complete
VNELKQLHEENQALRKAIGEAAHEMGFLSDHLRGRMAKGAIFNLAKKADELVKLSESPSSYVGRTKCDNCEEPEVSNNLCACCGWLQKEGKYEVES